MQDTFFVRDLETMKALSDPRRVEILGLLQKPRTTRQVADVLGETANAMYYHILELEKYQLIKVVKTAMKGHIQEKYYQAVARFYSPASDLFESRFDPYKTEIVQTMQGMQETALNELHKVMADFQMDEKPFETNYMVQKHLRLSSAKQANLHSRLAALIQEFEGEQPDDGDQALLMTVFLFPVSHSQDLQSAC
ncbi:MAG: helix-turn-helix domain-containing protein [Chloroflexi bacterium]|nr:helix-turn-helix domain-containing protein [Chloroflexota bacterium]